MTTRTVTVQLSTVTEPLPIAVEFGGFLFKLLRRDTAGETAEVTQQTLVTFEAVEPGTYTVAVSAVDANGAMFGPSVTLDIEVPAAEEPPADPPAEEPANDPTPVEPPVDNGGAAADGGGGAGVDAGGGDAGAGAPGPVVGEGGGGSDGVDPGQGVGSVEPPVTPPEEPPAEPVRVYQAPAGLAVTIA